MRSQPPCNSACSPAGGASAQANLRQPVVFLSTSEEWNFNLWSSSKVELLQPEWGMITVLVRVIKASRMIVIFTASQDDRFHSTPAERHTRRKAPSSTSCQEHLGLRRTDKSAVFLIAATRLLGHRLQGHTGRHDSRRKAPTLTKRRQQLEASKTHSKFHRGAMPPRGRLRLEIEEENAGKESIWHQRSLLK